MTAHEYETETPLSVVARANVKAEMARRGWRQEDMARRLMMPRATLASRCSGRTPWTLDEMQKAASVFRMPLSELLLPRLDSNQQPFVYESSEASEGVVVDLAAYRAEREAPVTFGPLAMFGPLSDLERRRAARGVS